MPLVQHTHSAWQGATAAAPQAFERDLLIKHLYDEHDVTEVNGVFTGGMTYTQVYAAHNNLHPER